VNADHYLKLLLRARVAVAAIDEYEKRYRNNRLPTYNADLERLNKEALAALIDVRELLK
jgi:hypothetical protein